MLFFLLVVLLAENVASVRSPERPVVPNITAISSTEIRITWCRVNSNKVEIDHYELFIDTELEYSGVDVMYMAKRLKPWSWYEVKLRACGFSPGSCSPFSRPALVKTLRDGDNSTVIQSGVILFKVIVVPTYMFILGMIAGVFAISFVLMWRYLQCADLSSGSAFELPQYQTAPTKKDQSALIMQSLTGTRNNAISSLGSTAYQTKACQVDNDNESHYLEIPNSEKADPKIDKCIISDCLPFSPTTSVQLPRLYLPGSAQEGQVPIPEEGIALNLSDGYPEHQKDEENRDPTHENCTQIENRNETYPLNDDRHDKQEQETQNTKVKDTVQTQERTKHWSNLAGNLIMPLLIQTRKQKEVEGQETIHKEDISLSAPMVHTLPTNVHYQFTEEKVTTEQKNDSSSFSHHGVVVAIDNSNIYIGAQECASMVNPNDRKRHVRLKLQNLVKILERERSKTRGFACGSSPPATDHVWDVYRRLGYIVDLEDRRGKDEQRVDEGLHLWIYKAICELPPGVLVLATGDGMKGKSECDTSFPRCAMTALERGWSVEVYSWKHSLSNEWIKLTKKHPDMLTINYLDKYVNYITFVDGKYGRKCAPLPPEANKLQT